MRFIEQKHNQETFKLAFKFLISFSAVLSSSSVISFNFKHTF